MIYLISGPPRCGKTTLAKMLGNKLGFITWISVDMLESVVRMHTSKQEQAEIFPKNVMRQHTTNSNDLMYTRFTAEQIANAYIQQAKASWLAIRVCIQCKLAEHADLILEGHQIHPELIAQLQTEFGPENIRSIVLYRTNQHYCLEDCRKSTAEDDWFIKKTQNPDIHEKIAAMIVWYGKFMQQQAYEFKIPCINLDYGFDQINSALIVLGK